MAQASTADLSEQLQQLRAEIGQQSTRAEAAELALREEKRQHQDDVEILEAVKTQLEGERKQNGELRMFAAKKASEALSALMAWQDIDEAVQRFSREPFSKTTAAAVGAARTKWHEHMAAIAAANRPKEGTPS